jgi:hypothetical protein
MATIWTIICWYSQIGKIVYILCRCLYWFNEGDGNFIRGIKVWFSKLGSHAEDEFNLIFATWLLWPAVMYKTIKLLRVKDVAK